ncbi:MAG: hypothetical protein KGL95_16330, partial [Patescibacteria group bacterium]|nr:hypothetical protein [Patescibacteria group bacterium]
MRHHHLNIAFRTRGGRAPGKELGLGHVYRCINLSYFLKRNKLFFLLEDFGGARKIVRENGIKKILSLKPEINLKLDIQQTVAFIHTNKIDVLIIDSYKVKPRYLAEVKKYVKVVLISDLRNIDYSADLVVNGFIGFDNQTLINKYGSKCLLGP